jgi:hypothetical protein
MTDFAREVDSTVAGALNPGERVLWTGHCLSRLGKQQHEQRTSRMGMVLGWPISILFAGIGLLNLLAGLSSGPIGRVIGGAILLAIGVSVIYVLITGLFRDSKMFCRKQTAYVLTDQRAFVLKHCRTAVPMRSVDWHFVDHVRAEWVELDGRGTVQFQHWDPMARQWQTILQFYKIASAHQVAERAQGAMAQANGQP